LTIAGFLGPDEDVGGGASRLVDELEAAAGLLEEKRDEA
jgi:hypothetical protein